MSGIAIWDRQHAGKRSRPSDMGAASDLDRDGQVEVCEREAELTPQYIHAGHRDLVHTGLQSAVIDPLGAGLQADYPERHRQARQLAAGAPWAAYMACHLNAGGGDYGLVGYLPGDVASEQLAHHIAAELELVVPVLSRCRVESLEGRWVRGRPTIAGIASGPQHLAGVLLEPLFLDHAAHQEYILARGLEEVGRAVARAVMAWGMGRGHA